MHTAKPDDDHDPKFHPRTWEGLLNEMLDPNTPEAPSTYHIYIEPVTSTGARSWPEILKRTLKAEPRRSRSQPHLKSKRNAID